MLDLVGAEIGDGVGQFGVGIAKFIELLAIMPINLGLDRGGARHCGFGADQRGRHTQAIARDVPEWLEQRRAHAAPRDHRVECRAVAFLLHSHRGDGARGGGSGPHHRQLPGINPGRTIFTGLVDAQHRFGIGGHALVGHRDFLTSAKMVMPPAIEKSALNPASEAPHKVHCAASQRINGARIISSSERPVLGAEHGGPSHQ